MPGILDDPWFWVILTALVSIGAFMFSMQRSMERFDKKHRQEFEELYPGRCYVCWNVRMAKAHGHLPESAKPRPHECKEGHGG